MKLYEEIKKYIPFNEQEEKDRGEMLRFLERYPDAMYRENTLGHFTASAWIVNPERTKTLMVYHNLYHSWAWTGGHADGDTDLLFTALREAREETGIIHVRPVLDEIFSLEILAVEGHIKHGKYVSSHLHYNVTYLLEADETDDLKVNISENKAVRWWNLDKAVRASTEPWMVENVYRKLMEKTRKIGEIAEETVPGDGS